MVRSPRVRGARRLGRVGTVTRVCIGLILAAAAVAVFGLSWWDVVGATLVMPALAVGFAAVTNHLIAGTDTASRARQPWSRSQIAAAATIVGATLAVGTALTFVSPIDGTAIYLFAGVSMILAAVLGFDGCEVLALPNLVLGRRDAIWCPLYSPIDRVERRVRRKEAL